MSDDAALDLLPPAVPLFAFPVTQERGPRILSFSPGSVDICTSGLLGQYVESAALPHLIQIEPHVVFDDVRLSVSEPVDPENIDGTSCLLAYVLTAVACYWRPRPLLSYLLSNGTIWVSGALDSRGHIVRVDAFPVKLGAFLKTQPRSPLFIVPAQNVAVFLRTRLLKSTDHGVSGPTVEWNPKRTPMITLQGAALLHRNQQLDGNSLPFVMPVWQDDLRALLNTLFVDESRYSLAWRERMALHWYSVAVISRTLLLGMFTGAVVSGILYLLPRHGGRYPVAVAVVGAVGIVVSGSNPVFNYWSDESEPRGPFAWFDKLVLSPWASVVGCRARIPFVLRLLLLVATMFCLAHLHGLDRLGVALECAARPGRGRAICIPRRA